MNFFVNLLFFILIYSIPLSISIALFRFIWIKNSHLSMFGIEITSFIQICRIVKECFDSKRDDDIVKYYGLDCYAFLSYLK
jgi:hypothetical protein